MQSEHVLTHWRAGQLANATAMVAQEVPVALCFNGISHAVMMASPCDLEDLACGFALSEGIVQSMAQLHGVEVQTQANGIEVHVELAAAAFASLKERRRSLLGATGCGLCGADSLAVVTASRARSCLRLANPNIAPEAISAALNTLPAHQTLNTATGCAHAAAWASPHGQVLCVREDVGRHNALDKLIGALAGKQLLTTEGLVAMSSRASYELVNKCAQVGIHTLAVISAPTTAAIDHANTCGITLWAFCRGEALNRYTG